MHPGVHHLMTFFQYDHLPPHLQEVSKPCTELAVDMCQKFGMGASAELTAGLRKLLEAKDCFVREASVQHAKARQTMLDFTVGLQSQDPIKGEDTE